MLRWGVAAAAVGLGAVDATETAAKDGEDALDEALQLLQDREPESRQGLSTHAPMVAEALTAMGHGRRAVSWVEKDRGRVLELPKPSRRIDRERWRAELGPRRDAATWEQTVSRWGDWRLFFQEELESAPWQTVLDTWTGRLSKGLSAAATHGIIRTAHAARALARRQTPARRGELARGLAYWAAAYEELPAVPRAASAGTPLGFATADLATALNAVPRFFDVHGQAPTGNIVSGLHAASALRGFESVRDLVSPGSSVADALSGLSLAFTKAYLRHGTKHHAIAFVHAVTGPTALRRLLPHLRPETARAALPYAWQTAAGIYAAYARRGGRESASEPRLSREELAARAIANGDAHAIKFTEVLLAEHRLNPDPAYLLAAEDANQRL